MDASHDYRLAHLGALLDETIQLPWSGARYAITRPHDIDSLLDYVADDPEQNLPYWAEVWPSGIALADAIAREPDRVAGRQVLELGCGLGVTATAALRAGANLVISDYSPDALALADTNTCRNGGGSPAAVRLNWRQPSSELFELAPAGFPIVLAADVLYESRDIEPLLAFCDRIITPGGMLWLAEPGRAIAERFLQLARAAGWTGTSAQHAGPWPDAKDGEVIVGIHTLYKPNAHSGIS